MRDPAARANWTADDKRYVNSTYSPMSRLTEEAWLQSAKVHGIFEAWLAANPAPAEDLV